MSLSKNLRPSSPYKSYKRRLSGSVTKWKALIAVWNATQKIKRTIRKKKYTKAVIVAVIFMHTAGLRPSIGVGSNDKIPVWAMCSGTKPFLWPFRQGCACHYMQNPMDRSTFLLKEAKDGVFSWRFVHTHPRLGFGWVLPGVRWIRKKFFGGLESLQTRPCTTLGYYPPPLASLTTCWLGPVVQPIW